VVDDSKKAVLAVAAQASEDAMKKTQEAKAKATEEI